MAALARSTCLAPIALFALALGACGGGGAAAQDPKSPEARPEGSAAEATTAAVTEKTTSLKRSQVREAITKGVGAFLRNVAVEDMPEMRNGKFYGFRIRAINPDWSIDLRPGDVILRINGVAIEHPEDADAALRSLDKAASLRVDYERDGRPGVFELPIVDEAAPPPKP